MVACVRTIQLIAALLLWNVSAQSAPTAVEELAQLQKQAHAARVAGDQRGYLDAAIKVRRLLNDAPDAIEATAIGYAALGDNEHALAALNEFAAMGQADDVLLAGKTSRLWRFTIFRNTNQSLNIFDRTRRR